MAYYQPTPTQHLAMFPDGKLVNSVRSLNVATAAALGLTAATHTKKDGYGVIRIDSLTTGKPSISDGVIFASADDAKRFAVDMCSPGYAIAHITWED